MFSLSAAEKQQRLNSYLKSYWCFPTKSSCFIRRRLVCLFWQLFEQRQPLTKRLQFLSDGLKFLGRWSPTGIILIASLEGIVYSLTEDWTVTRNMSNWGQLTFNGIFVYIPDRRFRRIKKNCVNMSRSWVLFKSLKLYQVFVSAGCMCK